MFSDLAAARITGGAHGGREDCLDMERGVSLVSVPCLDIDLHLTSSWAICPSACWFDTNGETGADLFWRALGIPLAEARLLAMEEDRSRGFDLRPLVSLGGWMVTSGEDGLLVSCFACVGVVVVAVAGLEGAERGTFSPAGFSLLDLNS